MGRLSHNAEDSVLVYLRKGADGASTDPGLLQLHASRATTLSCWCAEERLLERDFQQRWRRRMAVSNVGNYPGCQTIGIGHHDSSRQHRVDDATACGLHFPVGTVTVAGD